MSEINKPADLKPEQTMIPRDFDFNFTTVKDVSAMFANCESVSPEFANWLRRNDESQRQTAMEKLTPHEQEILGLGK